MKNPFKNNKKIAVYGALAANFVIAATKFAAAYITHSSAMLSEAIHSLADTANEILLLFGIWRSQRKADIAHPFGYGREIYFWGFVVALMLFGLGGVASIMQGIRRLHSPVELGNPFWNYVVLAISFVSESSSFYLTRRQIPSVKNRQLLRAVQRSKDPSLFVVLIEDMSALIGLTIALAGVYLGYLFKDPRLDAVASIGIGLMLCIMALLLVRESMGLIIGESAHGHVVDAIQLSASKEPLINLVGRPLTLHIGPRDVTAVLPIKLLPHSDATQITEAIERLKASIQHDYPAVQHLFVDIRH